MRVRGELADPATRQEQNAAEHHCQQPTDGIAGSGADDRGKDQEEDEADHGQISWTSFVRELTR